ncbi:MAG: peroxiredoxin family protein [Planctomycetes bacterium]|nr:peroxiredoxin family protein [Planctomycetota bacterium]
MANHILRAATRAACGLLVLCSAAGSSAVNGAPPSEESAPAPTLTEYSVRQSWTREAGEDDKVAGEFVFTVKAYDVRDAKSERRIIAVVLGDLVESENLPIGAIRLDSDRAPEAELEHPVGRLISGTLIPALFPKIPPERIAAPGTGSAEIEIPKPRIDKIPVEFSTTEQAPASAADEARIAYVALLKNGPFVAQAGTTITKITSLEHRFEFAKSDRRVLRGQWSHNYERTYGGTTRMRKESLEVVELLRRTLSPVEATKVAEQYASLISLNEALLPGAEHALRETKEGAKLKKTLDLFKKKYSGELLAEAVADLERALGKVFTKLELPQHPEERAKLMLGKKAPEFALKDLAGKEVKLADYKGQIVMICFWAYL